MDNNNNVISMLDSYFYEFWELKGIDIDNTDNIQINRFNSCMMYIHSNYIKPCLRDNSNNNQISDINRYKESDVINIINWCKDKLYYYNIVSMYSICLLLDINKQSIYNIIGGDVEVTELMRRSFQNYMVSYQELALGKANDTTIGLITNINNNQDMGLMYNKQNIVINQQAKKLVSMSDLPKLSDI